MSEVLFTDEEYKAFAKSVRDCESRDQVARVRGRLAQSKMVEELGKDKCDAMWQKFLKHNPEH